MSKGSKWRKTNYKSYFDNFDNIDWGKKPAKKQEKVKTAASKKRNKV